MSRFSRRIFVLGGLSTAGLAGTAGVLSAAPSILAVIPYPFKLGIASGEPASNGVVLWTRLAPSPLNADGQGGMPNANIVVDWQVSTSDRFSTLAASGSITAAYTDAHSVHVEVAGLN